MNNKIYYKSYDKKDKYMINFLLDHKLGKKGYYAKCEICGENIILCQYDNSCHIDKVY